MDDLRLAALEALQSAVHRSRRTSTVGFPPSFVRAEHGRPPLARLIQGGQGGRARLPLYLNIVMMATRYPHTLTNNSLTPSIGLRSSASLKSRGRVELVTV